MLKFRQFAYRQPWWAAVGVGVTSSLGLYLAIGLIGWAFVRRFPAEAGQDGSWLLISVAFLLITPFVTGFTSAATYLRYEKYEEIKPFRLLTIPAMTLLVEALIMLAVKWEGIICIVMISPAVLLFSILGAWIALIMARRQNKPPSARLQILIFPLLFVILEANVPSPFQVREVQTQIMIHAPLQTVWANVASVPAISPSELPGSWVQKIGFPLPIAATLSHPGVGGIRRATFTGNLTFTETVNRWDQDKDLRFSIRANTDTIPKTTLDEHLVIGGRFFDVLDGEYMLEPRPDGVMLQLASRERLSTHVNPYAGLWTDAVMRAIQNQILIVVRNRCEAQAALAQAAVTTSP